MRLVLMVERLCYGGFVAAILIIVDFANRLLSECFLLPRTCFGEYFLGKYAGTFCFSGKLLQRKFSQ